MSRRNYNPFETETKVGVIKAIDYGNDTCDVKIDGVVHSGIWIHYHCDENEVDKGGSSPFGIGDKVLCLVESSVVKEVFGWADGVRIKCYSHKFFAFKGSSNSWCFVLYIAPASAEMMINSIYLGDFSDPVTPIFDSKYSNVLYLTSYNKNTNQMRVKTYKFYVTYDEINNLINLKHTLVSDNTISMSGYEMDYGGIPEFVELNFNNFYPFLKKSGAITTYHWEEAGETCSASGVVPLPPTVVDVDYAELVNPLVEIQNDLYNTNNDSTYKEDQYFDPPGEWVPREDSASSNSHYQVDTKQVPSSVYIKDLEVRGLVFIFGKWVKTENTYSTTTVFVTQTFGFNPDCYGIPMHSSRVGDTVSASGVCVSPKSNKFSVLPYKDSLSYSVIKNTDSKVSASWRSKCSFTYDDTPANPVNGDYRSIMTNSVSKDDNEENVTPLFYPWVDDEHISTFNSGLDPIPQNACKLPYSYSGEGLSAYYLIVNVKGKEFLINYKDLYQYYSETLKHEICGVNCTYVDNVVFLSVDIRSFTVVYSDEFKTYNETYSHTFTSSAVYIEEKKITNDSFDLFNYLNLTGVFEQSVFFPNAVYTYTSYKESPWESVPFLASPGQTLFTNPAFSYGKSNDLYDWEEE